MSFDLFILYFLNLAFAIAFLVIGFAELMIKGVDATDKSFLRILTAPSGKRQHEHGCC